MFRLIKVFIMVVVGLLAVMMSFSAIVCHVQGHLNRWAFTLAAFVVFILLYLVTTGKEPNGTR